jgi:hypothetical protein
MQTGFLFIEDDNQLFLIIPGKGRTALPPGADMEIHLGGHWIAGHYWPDLDEQDRPVGQHDFKDMEESSFCGLASGMKARIGGKGSN